MDVINKLYSSVTSTVSQLSSVLPGNPLSREYEVLGQVGSAGPGLLWRIHAAVKRSTKQEAAVFVCDKRQLDRWPKDDREQMLDILRRGVVQLTKIRHPRVLTVQHPLEESRDSYAFATEPVFASLENIIQKTRNLQTDFTVFKLHDVEIKHGLLQLIEGLAFLHADVKMIHRNLCPHSIIVNSEGAWKLFGFEFCVLLNGNEKDGAVFQEYNPSWQMFTQPPLEYMAPEIAATSNVFHESDVFSFGMLIYSLHSQNGVPLRNFGKDYISYKKFANDLRTNAYSPNLTCIPEALANLVRQSLSGSTSQRPSIHDIAQSPHFEDIGVKTLTYLDSLYQWDNLQKSKFYKSLPQVLNQLPHRINLHRILPALEKEFANPAMIPFVLPNCFVIAESATKDEFRKKILPALKPCMRQVEPIQILLLFMQKMDLLLKMTPPEEIKTDVLPMLYRALDQDSQSIQEHCLTVLPTFASLIDHPAMKNALLPRVKKLCLRTPHTSVRVQCLLCVGQLLEHFDKWLVLDDVLPFLAQIKSREPPVLMAILGIIKVALTHRKLGITKEVLANQIVPMLMPLCIENTLTVVQFNSLMSLIKDVVNRVEAEHRQKLEQLNQMRNETKSMDFDFNANNSATTGMPITPISSPATTDFSANDIALRESAKTFSDMKIGAKEKTPPKSATIDNFFGNTPIAPISSPPTAKTMTFNNTSDRPNNLGMNGSTQNSFNNSNFYSNNVKSPPLVAKSSAFNTIPTPINKSYTPMNAVASNPPPFNSIGGNAVAARPAFGAGATSVYDSLIPKQGAVTMGQSFNQPLLPSGSNGGGFVMNSSDSSKGKELSAQEIMDFLN